MAGTSLPGPCPPAEPPPSAPPPPSPSPCYGAEAMVEVDGQAAAGSCTHEQKHNVLTCCEKGIATLTLTVEVIGVCPPSSGLQLDR